ncbi:MAG: hypothetical protein OEZ36_00210 [Spirochaetota bacterium]|nr:hypothetical protein [Spirochaetota bacterium]
MGKRKLYIIILIVLLVFGGLYLRDYILGKGVIARYDREIKSLLEDKKDNTDSINHYYKSKNKKTPRYLFFINKRDSELKALLARRYEIQSKLASYYQLKGDYFLKELYRKDKYRPPGIWRDHFKRYTQEKLELELRAAVPEAQEAMELIIKTRKLAIKNYDLACEALEDRSSEIYTVRKMDPVIKLNPLVVLKKEESFIELFEKDSSLFRKYLSSRVMARTHFNKGLAYRQLASFYNYSDISRVSESLLEAEREFWIAVGVDELFLKGFYFIAESYFYRYDKVKDVNRDYYLSKTMSLLEYYAGESGLSEMVTFKVFYDKPITKDVKHRMSQFYYWKSLFLLGRVYVELAGLSKPRLEKLQLKYSMLFKPRVSVKENRVSQLRKAIIIYKDRLMGIIPEKSPTYKAAEENYLAVRNELESESPEDR